MPRRRRTGRRRPYKVVKYSNETTVFNGNITGTGTMENVAVMIASVAAQGMRKAKNFSLQFITTSEVPVYFALVYVPQGTDPSHLNYGTPEQPVSLYEPNQNVILVGCSIANSPQQTWRTRLARNLNSGDSIQLRVGCENGYTTSNFAISLNYAITY